ncbi:expressed unknown protein [Seminavis robusta]|uniref:C2H2-type domain-containing protein n=1 Tax=Seminavis robusta TaxID=568900 RepID=A0A9N8H6V5_9STRA|nr:expressed unknown protein [Seminavis robusta]|eukprot:Sro54_g031670.1 n/a (453) ;mRNA; f:10735-12093
MDLSESDDSTGGDHNDDYQHHDHREQYREEDHYLTEEKAEDDRSDFAMNHRHPHHDLLEDMETEETASDSVDSCDRRISRAARSLLVRPLRSILASAKKFYKDDLEEMDNLESATVWKLLEYSLAPHAYAGQKCPLLPSLDVLRREEEHSIVLLPPPKSTSSRLGISIRSAMYQLNKRAWWRNAWYQCGFCGKLFNSRYYLDRHLETHHANKTQHEQQPHRDDKNTMICPATTWCKGLPFCSQHALEIEPYYGKGSNGLSYQDRNYIKRQLEQAMQDETAHRDEATMDRTKQQCIQMIQDCFGGESQQQSSPSVSLQAYIHQHLEQSLCQPISCPDRLHQLFFAASSQSNDAAAMMMQHVHEWHDEWEDYYDQHHTVGRLGMAMLLGLVLWYTWYMWQVNTNDSTYKWLRRKDPKGTRLLQKRSTSTWKTARKKLWGTSTTSSKRSTKAKGQ